MENQGTPTLLVRPPCQLQRQRRLRARQSHRLRRRQLVQLLPPQLQPRRHQPWEERRQLPQLLRSYATTTPTGGTNLATPASTIQVTVQTNLVPVSPLRLTTLYSSTQTIPGLARTSESHNILFWHNFHRRTAPTGFVIVWTSWTGGGTHLSRRYAYHKQDSQHSEASPRNICWTMAHGTGGTVSLQLVEWRGSGTSVSITATPASGYSFTNWTGSGTGSFSGTNNPASITMNAPITENASFTRNTGTPTPQRLQPQLPQLLSYGYTNCNTGFYYSSNCPSKPRRSHLYG